MGAVLFRGAHGDVCFVKRDVGALSVGGQHTQSHCVSNPWRCTAPRRRTRLVRRREMRRQRVWRGLVVVRGLTMVVMVMMKRATC